MVTCKRCKKQYQFFRTGETICCHCRQRERDALAKRTHRVEHCRGCSTPHPHLEQRIALMQERAQRQESLFDDRRQQ